MTNSEVKYLDVLKTLRAELKTPSNLNALNYAREHRVNTNLFSILKELNYIQRKGKRRNYTYKWVGANPTLATARKVLRYHQETARKHTKTNKTPIVRNQIAKVSSEDIKYIETKILFGLFKIKSTIVR